MRCALIVTTHERPDALASSLASIAAQSVAPDEVLIADDGSGAATRELVAQFAVGSVCPVHHLWQPHQGFRAGRARNLAIARSSCEYLVLLDGDMVVEPHFIEDHRAVARPGYWSQGTRVMLDALASQTVLTSGIRTAAAAPGLTWRGRAYARRLPALSRGLLRAANTFIAVKSCNQGMWRQDLLRVNGFDEEMTGWGCEDKELCSRLANAGVLRQTLLWSAIAFHLHHPPAARDQADRNRSRWLASVQTGRTRCARGLADHLQD